MSLGPVADRRAAEEPLQVAEADRAARRELEAALSTVEQAVAAVRPLADWAPEQVADHVNQRLLALSADAARVERLRQAVHELLTIPAQHAFFAEAGLRSAKGFVLELASRVGQRLLPLLAQAAPTKRWCSASCRCTTTDGSPS